MGEPDNRDHLVRLLCALILGGATIIAAIITTARWKADSKSNGPLASGLGAGSVSNQNNEAGENYYSFLTTPNPYPNGTQIRVGTSLLEIQIKYSATIANGACLIPIESGPFDEVYVIFEDKGLSPARYVSYSFRNSQAAQQIREQAEKLFPSAGKTSHYLGESVSWSDFNGVDVEINSKRYLIRKH